MVSFAMQELGLTIEQSLALSPRLYLALVDRWKAQERRSNWRVANVMALLANIHRGKDVKAFTPDDFMPQEKAATAEQGAQTWQQQLAFVEMLNAAFKGRRVKKTA